MVAVLSYRITAVGNPIDLFASFFLFFLSFFCFIPFLQAIVGVMVLLVITRAEDLKESVSVSFLFNT